MHNHGTHKHRIPDLTKRAFARTNVQTITQRVTLMRELVPGVRSITEICCGDCTFQYQAYTRELGIHSFCGLDIEPAIVAANQARGIDCICADALEKEALRRFVSDDVIFFGPPLSETCDGHRLLRFDEVLPGYGTFTHLLLGELQFAGLLVCICPNSTSMGNITRLYQDIRFYRPDINLRLIHYSYATITGSGEVTERRLKYIELWFSSKQEDLWEIRESGA